MYLGSHRNLGGNPELPDTFFFIIYQVDCLWFILVNLHLVRHYMRGVFDGDGCISIHKKREGSRDTTDRGQVNLCSASKNFIEEYVDRLHVCCGITKNKIRNPKGTYYVIDWGSFGDIEKFYDFFYSNASVYLKRKKETFDVAHDISKTKIRYRKK